MPKTKTNQVSIRKRKPSAEMILAEKPVTDDDVRTVILFMGEQGISLKSACKQKMFNYNSVVERITASPALRALDSEVRCQYVREKVREMNMIATLEEDPQRARLKCDNIKWEAARIMRSEFGDHVTVAGDKENPLVLQLVKGAEDLVKSIRQGQTYEHDAADAS